MNGVDAVRLDGHCTDVWESTQRCWTMQTLDSKYDVYSLEGEDNTLRWPRGGLVVRKELQSGG